MKYRVLFLSLIFVFNSCGTKKSVSKKSRKTKPKSTAIITKEKSSSFDEKIVDKIDDKTSDIIVTTDKKKNRVLSNKNPNLSKVEQYILDYRNIAVAEMIDHGIPASITLAQGILESGSGLGNLTIRSNNHFGIKCHKNWGGDKVYHDDDEKGECFRKYIHPHTSFMDHSDFLTSRSRYSDLFLLNIKDYKGWARGLKEAGYATDPKYPNKLISIIEKYNLHQYDNVNSFDNMDSIDVKSRKMFHTSEFDENRIIKIVKKGDTLYSIAREFGVSVDQIKRVNKLNNNTISIDQKLIIPL